jgi:hypothetical protein
MQHERKLDYSFSTLGVESIENELKGFGKSINDLHLIYFQNYLDELKKNDAIKNIIENNPSVQKFEDQLLKKLNNTFEEIENKIKFIQKLITATPCYCNGHQDMITMFQNIYYQN